MKTTNSPKFSTNQKNINNLNKPKEKPSYFSLLPEELRVALHPLLSPQDAMRLSQTSKQIRESFDNFHFWKLKLSQSFGINNLPSKDDIFLKDLYRSLHNEFINKYEQADFKFLIENLMKEKGTNVCSQDMIYNVSRLLLHNYEFQGDEIAGLFRLGIREIMTTDDSISRRRVDMTSLCIKHLFFDEGMSLEEAKQITDSSNPNCLHPKQIGGIAGGLSRADVENFPLLRDRVNAYSVARLLVKYRGKLTLDDFTYMELFYDMHRSQVEHRIQKKGVTPIEALGYVYTRYCYPRTLRMTGDD